jgi:large subunit ribosomal protein L29
MAKVATAAELRGQSRSELDARVRELKEELFTLRFQSATGQLESHGRLRAVRKDIARIYTVLQERELGIVVDPDQAVEAEPQSDAARSEAAAPAVERVKA